MMPPGSMMQATDLAVRPAVPWIHPRASDPPSTSSCQHMPCQHHSHPLSFRSSSLLHATRNQARAGMRAGSTSSSCHRSSSSSSRASAASSRFCKAASRRAWPVANCRCALSSPRAEALQPTGIPLGSFRCHPFGCRPFSASRQLPGSPSRPTSHVVASLGPEVAALGPDLAVGAGVVAKVITDLGVDALLFLATTVVVVPAAKFVKVSPILGFLGAGVLLNQFGLFRNVNDIETVSELGILFLLFQMGLELSLDRLKELAKFAFGLGLSQILTCTIIFSFLGLPSYYPFSPSALLEYASSIIPSLPPPLTSALSTLPPFPTQLFSPLFGLTLDEDIIIAMALSLSSSAFVLKLLGEGNELDTRHGSATLGVLLMQDIAVVPLLAILPVLEGGFSAAASVGVQLDLPSAASTYPSGIEGILLSLVGGNVGGEGALMVFQQLLEGALKGLAGLGLILLGGEFVMKRAFRVVDTSDSPEAFLALSLLAVTGTALLTQQLGFSDSLGAFLAGAILSTSTHKHAVQQYTGPLERLLLGLFFLTTGTSIDISLLQSEYPSILAVVFSLLAVKTAVIGLLGPRFGLSGHDSIRTAFVLSQGGEFAFVVLALANQLGVLPLEVDRFLIIVVVMSMALTPFLNECGKVFARVGDFVVHVEPEVLLASLPIIPDGSMSKTEEDLDCLFLEELAGRPIPSTCPNVEDGLKMLRTSEKASFVLLDASFKEGGQEMSRRELEMLQDVKLSNKMEEVILAMTDPMEIVLPKETNTLVEEMKSSS